MTTLLLAKSPDRSMDGKWFLADERRRALLVWASSRGRSFTWRREQDPWKVLLTELLLRRTKATQVQRFLPEILDRFPTPYAVSSASVTQVRSVLEPLGLQ